MTEESRDWVRWPYVALLAVAVGLVAGFHFYEWVRDWAPWGVDGWQFTLGLLVALPIGHYASIWVLSLFRDKPSPPDRRRRARWVGYLERALFATAVAIYPGWFSLGGAVAWISAKVAVNWGPRVVRDGEETRVKAMSALLSTLASLMLAVIGGLTVGASLPQDLTIFHP